MMDHREGLNGHVPDLHDQPHEDPRESGEMSQIGADSRPDRHPEIEEQLAAYAAHELAPVERAKVARHLAGCAACRAALTQTQHIRALLHGLGEPATRQAPIVLADAVMARLAEPASASDDEPIARDAAEGWPAEGSTNGMERDRTPVALDLAELSDGAIAASRAVSRIQRQASTRRGGLIPALVATAAIVLVSALLFGLFGAALRPKPPVAHPTPHPSGPILPPYSYVTDLTMLSPSEGWAVGAMARGPASPATPGAAPRGPTTLTSLILHYSGGQWQKVSDTFPDVQLVSVSMYGPDDGWAVGRTMYDPLRGVVLRYGGSHWREIQVPTSLLPTPPPNLLRLEHMPAFDPVQVQAVGSEDAFIVDATSSLILHDQQGAWSVDQSQNEPNFGTAPTITMVSDTEGWATSYSGAIYHLRDKRWTTDLDLGGSIDTTIVSDVHMTSASEGWALASDSGTTYPPPGMPVPGQATLWLLHYHDDGWTKTMLPRQLYGAYGAYLSGVAIQPSGDGWITGSIMDQQTGTAFLLRYANGQVQPVPLPMQLNGLTALSMTSANEGWALGYNGSSQVLLHVHDGIWSVASQNWGDYLDTMPVNLSQATGWQRYTDATYGFTLEVPASYVTGGPTLAAQYKDQDPFMNLVFQGPYPTGDQIWINAYTNPDVDVNPGLCQYLGSGTPITVGAGIAGHQVDRTEAAPAPGIPGGVPAVEARFLSGGLYVDIQLTGQGPASTFMARYGATWRHVLASFTPGAKHPSGHACGS